MNIKILFILIFALIMGACENGKSHQGEIDLTTVSSLDIERYMGRWYEIARLPHFHERGLHSITANYTLQKDGKISVLNRGYFTGESLKEAKGKAYRPDDNVPGELKVSFFWIFYGDYLVLDLDLDYQWALVAAGNGDYLWILSRTPSMDSALYEALLQKARKRGFDLSKLIVVEQKRID